MSSDDFYDGIHLNEYGIKLYVKCVKKVLNPLLGFQTELKTETTIFFHQILRTSSNRIVAVFRLLSVLGLVVPFSIH
jgi:hypothetical protein